MHLPHLSQSMQWNKYLHTLVNFSSLLISFLVKMIFVNEWFWQSASQLNAIEIKKQYDKQVDQAIRRLQSIDSIFLCKWFTSESLSCQAAGIILD